MRILTPLLALAVCVAAPAAEKIKISELPPNTTPPATTAYIPFSDLASSNTYRASISDIAKSAGVPLKQRVAKTSGYTVVAADKGTLFDATGGTFTFALAASTILGAGWHCSFVNSGSGTVTIDPASTETIRTVAGSSTTLALAQGESVTLMCDGSGFTAVAQAKGGAGLGDAVQAGDNNFTGANAFSGPLMLGTTHNTTTINWSSLLAADFTSATNFDVAFSGSWTANQGVYYGITNTAATNISVGIPQCWSVSKRGYTTNITVLAGSFVKCLFEYDGNIFKLTIPQGPDDPTLSLLTGSGYFIGLTNTYDDTDKVLRTLSLADGYVGSVNVRVVANALTNTGTALFERTALFRNDGGTITRVGISAPTPVKSADATDWDATVDTDGTAIQVRVIGDALNPVLWSVTGWATADQNAPPICSTVGDSQTGTVSESTFAEDSYPWLATKFTATDTYTLCGVQLYLAKTGTPNGLLTAEIWTWDAVNSKPGTLVGSGSSGVLATTVPASIDWVSFHDMHADIVTGTAYVIMLKGSDLDDGSNKISWGFFYAGSGWMGASNDSGSSWALVNDGGPFKFKTLHN
jgi:hypothetical protein